MTTKQSSAATPAPRGAKTPKPLPKGGVTAPAACLKRAKSATSTPPASKPKGKRPAPLPSVIKPKGKRAQVSKAPAPQASAARKLKPSSLAKKSPRIAIGRGEILK